MSLSSIDLDDSVVRTPQAALGTAEWRFVPASAADQAERKRLVEALRRKALDSLNVAVLALDAGGRLLFANVAAWEMLRAGRWLRVAHDIVLTGGSVRETRELNQALDDVCSGAAATQLLSAPDGTIAVLTAAPFQEPAAAGGNAPLTGALVWIVPGAPTVSGVERFARTYDLSRAESRLLKLMACGHELAEASRAIGTSIHTVRNQLKSIFRRTGRRSQTHLLTLVAQLGVLRSSD